MTKMKTTLNFNTNVQLTLSQLTELARKLPLKERMKLASILMEEEEEVVTNKELVARIKEGLDEVKLYKDKKIQLSSLKEFLEDV